MVVWGVLYFVLVLCMVSLDVVGLLKIGVLLFMFVWGVIEVVWYSFYFFKFVRGDVSRAVTWCRYTLFIVLYLLGVSFELFLVYSGFKYLVKMNLLVYEMLNVVNFVFYLSTAMFMFFAGYASGFSMLYGYMFG